MNWNKFTDFYDWEFDLFCTEQKRDVDLWLDLAEKYGDPILELACGSGRITIPLAKNGFKITAVDYSENMLQLLEKRSQHLKNITPVHSNMIDFSLTGKYKFAFISYSSFQQLLKPEEQIKCLNNISAHLSENGILAMDIGRNVCEGADQLEFKHLYTADYPQDDSTVSMFTSYTTDRINMIRYWKDKYLKVLKDGSSEVFLNKIELKECSVSYMRDLFETTGFQIMNIFGFFTGEGLTEDSNNAIYLVKKI
jgi:ubiquinone/menaquinone biosynthesis C-methylase UbiE